jgi:hypothetical protein
MSGAFPTHRSFPVGKSMAMAKRLTVIALGVAACLVVARGHTAGAAERLSDFVHKAAERGSQRIRPSRTIELRSYKGRPVGGYSYRDSDVASTYGRTPPPWLDIRQSPGGPFDSGFFFDSGISRGNNAPYPR